MESARGDCIKLIHMGVISWILEFLHTCMWNNSVTICLNWELCAKLSDFASHWWQQLNASCRKVCDMPNWFIQLWAKHTEVYACERGNNTAQCIWSGVNWIDAFFMIWIVHLTPSAQHLHSCLKEWLKERKKGLRKAMPLTSRRANFSWKNLFLVWFLS